MHFSACFFTQHKTYAIIPILNILHCAPFVKYLSIHIVCIKIYVVIFSSIAIYKFETLIACKEIYDDKSLVVLRLCFLDNQLLVLPIILGVHYLQSFP